MTELPNLTAEVRRATDYQINRQILKEKIQTDLHLAYNGGLFKISPELYSFAATWQGDPDNFFLEDAYGNPIKINAQEFVELATEHYSRVMNTWHQEHAELRQLRKI